MYTMRLCMHLLSGRYNSESTQHYVETPSLAQKLFIVAMTFQNLKLNHETRQALEDPHPETAGGLYVIRVFNF